MEKVTQLLHAVDAGDPDAAEQLLPLVYQELRRLAAIKLADEKPGQTLNPTGLVHEAYLRLVGGRGEEREYANRRHFLAAAAEAMRRILIDNARRKQRAKHGGERRRVELNDVHAVVEAPGDDLLNINEALEQFEKIEPDKAKLVKLRFFAGLTMPEAAAALGVSLATAERWWTFARSWLFVQLGQPG